MTTITGTEGDDVLGAPAADPSYEMDTSLFYFYTDSNGREDGIPVFSDSDINSTATQVAFVEFFGTYTQTDEVLNAIVGDINLGRDVLTYQLGSADLQLQSVRDNGTQPATAYTARAPQFSPDDQKILFLSESAFLDGTDTNNTTDAFIRHLDTGDTQRISVSEAGLQGDRNVVRADWISDTEVLLMTRATNMIDGSASPREGLYVKNVSTGDVTELAVDGQNIAAFMPGGTNADYKLSSNLRYFTFSTDDPLSSDEVASDNTINDVYVWDFQAGGAAGALIETPFSTRSDGQTGAEIFANSGSSYADISADGRYVAFLSDAGDLVENDTNTSTDVFLKDNETGVLTRISVSDSGGELPNRTPVTAPLISPDGSMVFFTVVNAVLTDDALPVGGYIYYIEEDRLDQVQFNFVDVENGGVVTDNIISISSVGFDGEGIQWLDDSSGLFWSSVGLPIVVDVNPSGSGGSVTLEGLGGNDTLTGGQLADTLDGGADNDILRGLAGADALIGGAGSDTADYSQDSENGATSGAVIELFRASATDGFGSVDTLQSVENATGTQLGDRIEGYSAANVLDGQDGDDILTGYAGNDLLIGGLGNDTLSGGRDRDTLRGGDGNDTLNGDGGNDTLEGDAGNDIMRGGDGLDIFRGGAGADFMRGGAGNDLLDGGSGNDSMRGEVGNDRMFGLDGDDYMLGGNGDDYVVGNAGDDLLVGGLGDDILQGREGNDRLFGEDGVDFLFGFAGADELNGGAGDDFLAGYEGNDLLVGGDGNDRFFGMENNDRLEGGNGDDFLIGNSGNDVLIGDNGNDNLRGRDGADELFGGSGNDFMTGGEGNDTLNGGGDFDTLLGEGGIDTFVFEGNWRRDTIADWTEGEEIDLSALELVGSGESTADAFAKLTIVQSGTTTIISVTGDTRNDIRLEDTDASTIDEGDFIFSTGRRRADQPRGEEENSEPKLLESSNRDFSVPVFEFSSLDNGTIARAETSGWDLIPTTADAARGGTRNDLQGFDEPNQGEVLFTNDSVWEVEDNDFLVG